MIPIGHLTSDGVKIVVEDMYAVVLTVIILTVRIVFLIMASGFVGKGIVQADFARDIVMRKATGGHRTALVVTRRLDSPDGAQPAVDILLIDDVVLVFERGARHQCIVTVADAVFIDSLAGAGNMVDGL